MGENGVFGQKSKKKIFRDGDSNKFWPEKLFVNFLVILKKYAIKIRQIVTVVHEILQFSKSSAIWLAETIFCKKKAKNWFSLGNEWWNVICNHTKHTLAQIAAKSNDEILR